jgi:bifunctional non-homologous end joining protein LigD
VVRLFAFPNIIIMESITLYFREGSSDKVYQASIQPHGGGHMVHFAYGRRGSTLTTGTKTTSPVDYQTAKSILDKLVREKTAKGYTPGEDGTRYQHTEKAAKATGIQCQLLNPVIEERVEDLIHDREHWMQEKMDGRRLLLQKEGSLMTGINRLGLGVSIPKTIADSASRYRRDFLIDGEAVGDTLHVFDLLFISGEDLRTRAFATRYFRLRDMLDAFDHPYLNLVPSYCFPEKKEWFHRFEDAGKEGVVFKHVEAPYTAGRPSNGGTQLKHKFHETASFIVTKLNDKRSVSLMLWESGKVRPAGNVTIPPNHDIPKPGEVVECRYLYAFKESGSIYQPVFLGRRDDIFHEECTTSQLKYKAEPMKLAA